MDDEKGGIGLAKKVEALHGDQNVSLEMLRQLAELMTMKHELLALRSIGACPQGRDCSQEAQEKPSFIVTIFGRKVDWSKQIVPTGYSKEEV